MMAPLTAPDLPSATVQTGYAGAGALPIASAAAQPVGPAAAAPTLRLGGNLQRDLTRLGIVPCFVVALALTVWFTQARLRTLDQAFDERGRAVVSQLAALSDLSLFSSDRPALQEMADAALRNAQVRRVELIDAQGVVVSAGAAPQALGASREFSGPVSLHPASGAQAQARAGSLPDNGPIGSVHAWLDTGSWRAERMQSLGAGVGIALIALLLAWAAVRRMARAVALPLRRVSCAVGAMQAGQFDVRCGVEARAAGSGDRMHEVVRLAQDVDHLAERLARNHELSEQRVRQATAVALERMAEAEQAALSRSRFLAAASHDLRQPLHAMGLFIDSLHDSASEAQRPAVQRLQESAQFMRVLLDDLLQMSRLDAQVMTPVLGDQPLAQLFDALQGRFAAPAGAAEIRLLWRDRGLAVRSDADLLSRVLGNLVSNALRHSRAGGTVLVAARRCAAGVRIEVRDAGAGIPWEHQPRVFEEFYQVANTARDPRQGFGLGLAICARIASLLGSRITLRSEPGRGSTFSITLPLGQVLSRPVPAAPGMPATSLARLACLVVDDDPATLAASRLLLAQWGCRVTCAASTAQALAHLAGDAPLDVLLCDLQLAQADDGLRVIDAARARHPEALAVLVSGATAPDLLQRVREHGVTLLTKPVPPAKLRALLEAQRRNVGLLSF